MKYALPLLILGTPVLADPALVEEVSYDAGRFEVTVSHGDTGWDDYADGWRVELADGTVLGTRNLVHPHVEEQPFTRSSSIAVPSGVTEVFIRTSTTVEGWADTTTRVRLD